MSTVQCEQYGEAVHPVAVPVAPTALEVVGGDEDPAAQSHPAAGGDQVADLRVGVAGEDRFGGGEEAVPLLGPGAQDGVHGPIPAAAVP